MKLLSSLRSRIFLASALLAMLCIGVAIYLVNQRVTQEAERTLEREMVGTGEQIDQLRSERTQTFMLMARLIADLPKLKAAIDTNDPPTVQDISRGYQTQLNASLVLVTNRTGGLLYTVGGAPRSAAIAAHQPAVREALSGKDTVSLLPQPNGILQMVTVPVDAVTLDRPRREILGTLSVAFLLDDALLAQLKRITGSDLAFGMDGQILASTLPRDDYPMLAGRLRTAGLSRLALDGEEYEVLPRTLSSSKDAGSQPTDPVVLILRSRTEQLKSLQAIHTGLFVTAVVAVLLAIGLSFGVARTIARPLAVITDAMREVAATGDLTRKIALRHRNRWDDDDARLLATTFNTLTDSVARFQREISQRERLASLGRLSTVIAHEVRNPLMIIKASLHSLGQPGVDATRVREAVHDIDEEVARLNRIVNEVLDFARPIRFDLTRTDVNALCRAAATAALASGPGADIALTLDPSLGEMTTDAERLRIALVNLLVNARHAVNGADAGAVSCTSRAAGARLVIEIADRGAGIAPDKLAQIFDPYFTTKRGGTGLGLPIAKNIIEGLGGTITVSSALGRGTDVRIELPVDSSNITPGDKI
jgi:signal transduction histidine kinase